LAALQERVARSLDAEGFPRPAPRYQRTADQRDIGPAVEVRVPGPHGARPTHRYLRSAALRYYGQAFEVRVPFPDGPVDPASTEATVAAFHDAHQRLYDYAFRSDPTQQVEWVNLRVTGIGPIRRPSLRPSAPGSTAGPRSSRPACFDPSSGFVDTAIYRRDDLGPGDRVEGPAVVEEYGATVPLHPGFRAEVDRFGILVVARHGSGRTGHGDPGAAR
ncbi:MAG: hypothetical protein ABW234_08455, partial [Actinomycetes bacterium]